METILQALLTPLTQPRQHILASVLAMLVIGVGQLVYPRVISRLDWDSIGYLDFYPHRTALYPAVLDVFGDNIDTVIVAQVIVHILSVGGMFYCLGRARVPVSVLAVFGIAISVYFISHGYHYTIMTESLAVSLVYLLIGFMAMYFGGGGKLWRWLWLGLAMLCAMLMFGMRPNALAFPMAVFMVASLSFFYTCYCNKRRQWLKTASKFLLALCIPIVLVAGFERAYFFAQHHQRNSSLLDTHLFGKAVAIVAMHEGGHEEGHAGEAITPHPHIYADGYEGLQPILARYGALLRQDVAEVKALGNPCLTIHTQMRYVMAGHEMWRIHDLGNGNGNILNSKHTKILRPFAFRVFAEYPMTLAGLTAGFYLHFFCVITQDFTDFFAPNEFVIANPAAVREKLNSGGGLASLIPLISLAFLGLGIAFFFSKFWYLYRWGRLAITRHFMAKHTEKTSPPPPPEF